MAEKSLARRQMSLVRKSLRKIFRGVGTVPEHVAMLRQSLRENREAVAAMEEAMCARAQGAAVAPPAGARDWRGEWDAVERGFGRPQSKLRALRVLFDALLDLRADGFGRGGALPPTQQAPRAGSIVIDVAPGELIDRLTILEIKLQRIHDEAKLRNVRKEYELLSRVCGASVPAGDDIAEMRARLKTVNEKIWQLEDDIRQHERNQDFGASFVVLARAVYHTNDQRAAIKRLINEGLKSEIVEEKSYQPY